MRFIDEMSPRDIEVLTLKGMLPERKRDLEQESRLEAEQEASGYWDNEEGENQ